MIIETQYTRTREWIYLHKKKILQNVFLPQHIVIVSINSLSKKNPTKNTKVFTCLPNHVATNSLKNRAWEHTVPILINILCITESKRFVQAWWITFIDFIKWNHLCRLNFSKRRLSSLNMRWCADRFLRLPFCAF